MEAPDGAELEAGISVMGEGEVELKLSSPKSMSETSLR